MVRWGVGFAYAERARGVNVDIIGQRKCASSMSEPTNEHMHTCIRRRPTRVCPALCAARPLRRCCMWLAL